MHTHITYESNPSLHLKDMNKTKCVPNVDGHTDSLIDKETDTPCMEPQSFSLQMTKTVGIVCALARPGNGTSCMLDKSW